MRGEGKKKKIIIDTNLLVSYFINGGNSALAAVIQSEHYIILASKELFQEYVSVLKRPKFKKYFIDVNVDDLLQVYIKLLTFVEINCDVKLCRDPNDDFIIQLAISSEADFLITGDNDILILESFGNCQFISLSEFILLNSASQSSF
jgi:putative PIN family toxin of toxin-antitoxin system